ncbi:polyphenol oxidase family protein [Georgenia sp. 10Sc9-8]|uniref:Polyphenol oxidase family protein n=1 Tax=Georgenia halotolerans TaxID=3028317 RepID=A0ABT5TWM5_9MICO|nr:polyphenol oxidase family protein [Georgenia halotolerans]
MAPEIIPARLGTGARGGFTTAVTAVAGTGGPAGPVQEQRAQDNRELLAEALGVPVQWMRQVHGPAVAVVTEPPAPGGELPEADVLVADARPGGTDLAVGVLVADCAPVLLASADAGVVAAVHVGRRGLLAGVLQAALGEMERRGVVLADLYAAVGPGICGRCYEVPEQLRDEVAAQVPGTAGETSWGTPSLDVPAGVLGRLEAAGVRRVHHVDRCTYEDDALFSYRRAGAAERFAGVVRTVLGD